MPGVFEALGDPVRRLILELLAAAELPAGLPAELPAGLPAGQPAGQLSELPAGVLVAAVQGRVPISQPAVSQHLRVLREAGLVRVHSAGTRRIYALDQAGLDAARAWLTRLADPLGPFAQPLDALATELARGQRAERGRSRPADRGHSGRMAR